MTTQDIAGILVTLIGAWLLYRSRKRVFDRRNAFGQEVFNSYRHTLSAHRHVDRDYFPGHGTSSILGLDRLGTPRLAVGRGLHPQA